MGQKLNAGDKIELPVKRLQLEGKRSYFRVTHNDRDYFVPAYPFQKDEPTPEKIACIVKEMNGDIPTFIQDYTPLLKKFYVNGETYPFFVRNDMTNLPNGYYEINDWYGFTFRLYSYNNQKLLPHQNIRCKTKYKGNRIYFIMSMDESESLQHKFIPFDLVLTKTSPRIPEKMKRMLRKLFLELPVLADARQSHEQESNEWMQKAAEVLDDNMSELIHLDKPERSRQLLETLRNAIVYLLEESDLLRQGAKQERRNYLKALGQAAQHAEDYIAAIDIIVRDEAQQWTHDQLNKLKNSGNLYQPERKLRLMMALFSLQQDMMEKNVDTLLNTINHGDPRNWETEPFRTAFVEMLELFVCESRRQIDHLASPDSPNGKAITKRICKALAIQLLLANAKDDIDQQLNKAMLYRYLSIVDGMRKDALLERAFECISQPYNDDNDYGWEDTRECSMLSFKLSKEYTNEGGIRHITQTYVGKKAQLRIENNQLQVLPIYEDGSKNVLPDGIIPWHNTQVMLRNHSKMNTPADIRGSQNLWMELERELFYSTTTLPQKKNNTKKKIFIAPETGDTVRIRITHPDDFDNAVLHCVIDDIGYEGSGTINIKDIVGYVAKTEEDSFRSTNGHPYYFNAKVTSVNKYGEFTFNLFDKCKNSVTNYVRQNYNNGENVLCKVKSNDGRGILCIDEFAVSMHLDITPDTEHLRPGDHIRAEIVNFSHTNQPMIEILEEVDAIANNCTIKDDEAFSNLMYNFNEFNAEGQEYIETDDEEGEDQDEISTDNQLDESYAREILLIISQLAMDCEDNLLSYNYLGIAKLISLMLGDEKLAEYYSERMKLLMMVWNYGINGNIDLDELKAQEERNSDIINLYPELRNHLTRLKVMASIDDDSQTKFLWDVLQNAQDEKLTKLVRLILANNLLTGFNLQSEKDQIRKKIKALLNIKVNNKETIYFGEEDQHTEFKTSTVFPPNNNMKPDIDVQTNEILVVIAGLLNSEGGTLYIGVNNAGGAAGLVEDMKYFNQDRDKFDLHIRNNIRLKLGIMANSKVKAEWLETDGKLVYRLLIQPCQEIVMLNDICYIRQGTSTWPLKSDDAFLENFKKERAGIASSDSKAFAPSDIDVWETGKEANNEQNTAINVTPAQAESATNNNADSKKGKVKDSLSQPAEVRTSITRPNVLHDYEDNYGVGTTAYVHLLPKGQYKVTDEGIWDDVELSLAIQEAEEDGYLIMVYESGSICAIPMGDVLDKQRNHTYNRFDGERLVWASPAKKTDALLIAYLNDRGDKVYRLDDVTNLYESNLQDGGKPATSLSPSGVHLCEIIEKEHFESFHKIHNLKETTMGNNIMNDWGKDARKKLKELGIEL